MIELSGTISRELSLKTDRNGNDYYYGQLDCEGSWHAFFFFRPDYDLTLRLTDLQANQELTLQGFWSKKNPRAFLASDFYLEEGTRLEESFGIFENDGSDEWRSG